MQVNPFDDIVPRETISQELEDEKEKKKKKKSKAKAHKAFNVLSFGAEAEEEEEDLVQAIGADKGKSKSAHDLARYAALFFQQLILDYSETQSWEVWTNTRLATS